MTDEPTGIETGVSEVLTGEVIPFGVREGLQRGLATALQGGCLHIVSSLRDGEIGNVGEWFTNLVIHVLLGAALGYLKNSGDVPGTRARRAKKAAV